MSLKPLKIIHLEDSPYDAEIIAETIKSTFPICEIQHVSTEKEFREIIHNFQADMVLADVKLPSFSGMKALEILKEQKPNLPLIFVTGNLGEEAAISTLLSGARDYVLKNKLLRLCPAISRVLEEQKDKEKIDEVARELVESEARFRNLFEKASIGIAMFNVKGEILVVNQKFCDMIGYQESELKGKHFNDFTHPDDKELSLDNFNSRINDLESANTFEKRYISKTGEEIWVEISASNYFDSNNKLTYLVSFIIDITVKKKAEIEIEIARQKADETSKLKSNILANLSHEFKTPMMGILGFSQILKDRIKDNELKVYTDKIEVSAKRLMSTLDVLVLYSKIVGETIKPSFEAFDLRDAISNTINELFYLAKRKNLDIRQESDQMIWLITDRDLLVTVIAQLLDNAIKFTKKGEVVINTGISPETKKLFISVSDTGIGIAQDDMGKIFQDFRQISEGLARGFEGNGLGLSLVERILKLLDASLTVNSTVNVGSTFTIWLPEKSLIKRPDLADERRMVFKTAKLSENKKPSVLLVEDNLFNSQVITLMIDSIYDVTPVFNGQKALEIGMQQHFDLILMDINLGPGIDGIETMHQLKKGKMNQNTPVIAVTGYAMPGDRQKMIDSGFDDYIAKPCTPKVLMNKMKRLLSDQML